MSEINKIPAKDLEEKYLSTIRQVHNNSTGIGKNIDIINKNIDEIAKESVQERSLFNSLIDNINTLDGYNTEVQRHYDEISEAVTQSKEEIKQNEGPALHALDTVTELVDSIADIEKDLTSLADTLKRISKVSSGIHTIAKQTNLLALNATIEAARAGEKGAGFSNVAEEVKNLAQETSAATYEIDNTLKNLTEETALLISEKIESNSKIRSIKSCRKSITDIFAEMDSAMNEISQSSSMSTNSSAVITSSCQNSLEVFEKMHEDIDTSTETLQEAKSKTKKLSEYSDNLVKTSKI